MTHDEATCIGNFIDSTEALFKEIPFPAKRMVVWNEKRKWYCVTIDYGKLQKDIEFFETND